MLSVPLSPRGASGDDSGTIDKVVPLDTCSRRYRNSATQETADSIQLLKKIKICRDAISGME